MTLFVAKGPVRVSQSPTGVGNLGFADLRGSRVMPEKPAPAVVVKAGSHRAQEEIDIQPIGCLVRDPADKWFFDSRGLFFKRVRGQGGVVKGTKDVVGTFECWRYGPRALMQSLTSEQRKLISNARRKERARVKRDGGIEI